MIIDLDKFIKEENIFWEELEKVLKISDAEPSHKMSLEELKRFHYLYERTSAGLARISTFSAKQELRDYLESLVARAFANIHENRRSKTKFSPFKWFFQTFPTTFRKYIKAFTIALLIISAGAVFGGGAVYFDTDAKQVIMPFEGLKKSPTERVKKEESSKGTHLENRKSSFASHLMANNIRVSIFVLALGMTFGVGTVLVLFINGIYLGAVMADYIMAGQSKFLAGWLLPHGSIEIPAIIIAGQAGLLLGSALIGWETPVPLGERLRKIGGDLTTLIFGVAVLLVWAGIIESFFSQYHEPVISYSFKIVFGFFQLTLLVLLLSISGRGKQQI